MILYKSLYKSFFDRQLDVCRCLLEEYPFRIRHIQIWGRGFFFILHHSAAVPRSDGCSDGVEPASGSPSKTVRPRAPYSV